MHKRSINPLFSGAFEISLPGRCCQFGSNINSYKNSLQDVSYVVVITSSLCLLADRRAFWAPGTSCFYGFWNYCLILKSYFSIIIFYCIFLFKAFICLMCTFKILHVFGSYFSHIFILKNWDFPNELKDHAMNISFTSNCSYFASFLYFFPYFHIRIYMEIHTERDIYSFSCWLTN